MLRNQSSKGMFTNKVYRRGLEYYNQGRVHYLNSSNHEDVWKGLVVGQDEYVVTIEFNDDGISYVCECAAHDKYRACKHSIAAMLEISDEIHDVQNKTTLNNFLSQFEGGPMLRQNKPRKAPDLTNEMINLFSNYLETSESPQSTSITSKPLTCEYILKTRKRPWDSPLLTIELKIGEERVYVVKKIRELLEHIEQQKELFFTKKFSYDPRIHHFTKEDWEVIRLLIDIHKSEAFYQTSWLAASADEKRAMSIPPLFIDRFLQLLQQRNCHFTNINGQTYENIEWSEGPLPFNFELTRDQQQENYNLDLHFLNDATIFEDYKYILTENTFYKLNTTQLGILTEMGNIIERVHNRTLPIDLKQIEPFLSNVMPSLNKIGELNITEDVSNEIIHPPLQAKLYLDLNEERLDANLEYHYDDYVFYPFDRNQEETRPESNQILIRDMEKEQEIMNVIENASFKYNGYELYIDEEDEIFSFIYDLLPRIEDKLDIFMTNQVKQLLVEERQLPKVNVDLDASENFLEINFDFEDINQDEIQHIFQSITEKKRYYRLPNGTFIPLEEESFSPITKLFDELNLQPDSIEQGKVTLPAYRGLQVEEFINKETGAKYNKAFRQLIQDIKNPDDNDYSIPDSLQADLRDYQNVGFQWLKGLSYYRFGGILADDMGLGKTLQAIAFLLSEWEEHNHTNKPSLVISPASLVYNWKSEFTKFAPQLNVVVVSGNKDERQAQIEGFQEVDVMVTSYPLIRQDVESYQELEFSTIILDEAQAIKNHLTKTARAVKSVKAQQRFALSGTPIENSLDELWSIFDAILPGFFPNKKTFNTLPQEQISRMSRPFILRRLKQDVLRELPDKIETVHTSELTKEQKQLYLGYLEQIQGEAAHAISTEGFQRSRMKILAGLTRLRQLCCHPSLFIEDYQGESGKLNQLLELVQNTSENGQRMLIFSQFSSMLKIIREKLQELGKDVFYLDGQTPSRERVDMAERFNQGEKEIFLISLKAGGTGLNLTGADTVILYDLWWNPAIEEQATGRAHRIGQKKVVQVFRLITEGTIEEKIYSLQQKKRELIENIIQPGETMFKSLSEDEIRELLSV
ncbi:DEAD/DEAH box helicase [Salinibacillus xinjiangensis]|uniref:DEAD/DEAH box helicase n=1 Tax=Salinibacillus xinjiangensis TaxID=1229268 RepID=A0A6G1X5X9_9BACI|nr:DEAD/DEAH box helicase [Salinibacillus xinjiangensis]MRG86374.1 DEAD/DEAH box helicase [Salinibacillus xinjiangensis]